MMRLDHVQHLAGLAAGFNKMECPVRAAYPKTVSFTWKCRPASRSKKVSKYTSTPKPHAPRLYGQRFVDVPQEIRSLSPVYMRSISLDSGAVRELLQAFGMNMAALTILPQYGWVLITLILSVFV